MLGAAGEQLAVYNGVQVKFKEQDETYIEDERFVYMYLHSFISAGGQLVTLANGTKQFNIVDNLGSVRCIVSWDGTAVSTQAFDYKPFGDLQEAGEENRIGYFGEQRDKESDYFAMGFRLYDPEIGRFLAIDPLLDMQPSQTPYHYCFNNPTSFTDPTGLYPEKEKGDKVLQDEKNMSYNPEQQAWYSFMEALRMEHFINWFRLEQMPIGVYSGFAFGKAGDGSTVAGYFITDCSTGRTGFSETGINGFIALTSEQKSEIQKNINLNIGSNVKNSDKVASNFWAAFWEGQGSIMTVENYEFLTTANLTVNIMQRDDYYFFSWSCALMGGYDTESPEKYMGWTSYGTICSTTMTFSESIFASNCIDFGWYNFQDKNLQLHRFDRDLSMVIMHEFGHSFAYFNIGVEYSSWYNKYQENWATWYMNQNYNIPRGIFPEKYDLNWLWLTGGFHRGYNPP